jgi:hypothetical protein
MKGSGTIIRKIHLYSAFMITGTLLMYIMTGFMMTRHNLWHPEKELSVTKDYSLSVPSGMNDEGLSSFVQKNYNLKGRKGNPSTDKNGVTTITYIKPGLRQQAIISPDRSKIEVVTTETNTRVIITAFHRVKGYGGGFLYNLYVFMTDLAGIGIIIFSVTGIIIAFSNRKNMIAKIIILAAGIGYTMLVVISFMRG